MIAEASKPQESLATVAARLTATRTADSPSAAATPQPDTAPAITGPSVTVVVEGANVRSGPGTDFPIVGGLLPATGSRSSRACSVQTTATIDPPPATGSSSNFPTAGLLGWIFASPQSQSNPQTTVPIAELPLIDPPPTPEPSPIP